MANFGTDPKGGGSYSYAERLSSTAMTSILEWLRGLDAYLGKVQGAVSTQSVPVSYADPGGWDARFAYWSQSSVASAYRANAMVPQLPSGSKINSATAYYYPDTGRSGVPGTLPQLDLTVINRTDGTYSSTSSSDTSASVGVYETYRTLSVSFASPVTVTSSEEAFVCFYGEAGANAQTGLRLHALEVNVTSS